MQAQSFLDAYISKVAPLEKNSCTAYWNATISGKQEDYDLLEKYQLEQHSFYADKNAFETIKKIKETYAQEDIFIKRQIDLVYNGYLAAQGDEQIQKEIISLETEIEKDFSTFRAKVGEKLMTDNDIDVTLATSTDSQEVQNTWEAHKEIGVLVSDKLRKLVHLRNALAHKLGFENYHTMSLALNEQNPNEIENIFDELDKLTSPTFFSRKKEIDEYLSKKFSINVGELKAWHYQNKFFQEIAVIDPTFKQDIFYKDQNLIGLAKRFFDSLGLDTTSILEKSDLYEKPGKNQHAYCIHLDRAGDVRILCNITPTQKWMDTILHELGHAVYDQGINFSLPFPLIGPAHIFVTEAIALFFGRFASDAQWIQDMTGISEEEKQLISQKSKKILQTRQILFSRRSQVMYRFEKELYANPDQDLQKLWWNLVERYQGISCPENRQGFADWASKIHVATAPCYYHNYLLGELLASQIGHILAQQLFSTENLQGQKVLGKTEIGDFLKTKIFTHGVRYTWNELITLATGEGLTSKYYAQDFCK